MFMSSFKKTDNYLTFAIMQRFNMIQKIYDKKNNLAVGQTYGVPVKRFLGPNTLWYTLPIKPNTIMSVKKQKVLIKMLLMVN